MSKYYSYIFYADRNVRPCTILGYSHNIPQKSQDIKCITRVIETSGTIAKEIKETQNTKQTPPNCDQKKDPAVVADYRLSMHLTLVIFGISVQKPFLWK